MKKLTSLEDTATITITGREAVMLRTLLGRTHTGYGYWANGDLFDRLDVLLERSDYLGDHDLDDIYYSSVKSKQESLAFPQVAE